MRLYIHCSQEPEKVKIKQFKREIMKKRNIFALVVGTMIATITVVTSSVQAQVAGTYKGLKAPATKGQTIEVTGTHASNRRAIDFGMKLQNVLAMKSGTVASVSIDKYGGKYILVDHGDNYCALYLHLNSFNVKEKDVVKQGQILGVSGNTGLGGQYHLHVAVFPKAKGACIVSPNREIAMIFDEKPNSPLKYKDKIVSSNGSSPIPSPQPSTAFQYPHTTTPSISLASINLLLKASNLSGQTVYWQMYRGSVGNLPPRVWNGQQLATSSSLTLRDLDGAGDTLKGVNYFTVVSLSPIASGEAAKQRTSCFATTGGTQLCDRLIR